jgi:hypothetical protein
MSLGPETLTWKCYLVPLSPLPDFRSTGERKVPLLAAIPAQWQECFLLAFRQLCCTAPSPQKQGGGGLAGSTAASSLCCL